MASANGGSQTCLHWVWSDRSEVNACAERSLFKDYTKFTTEAWNNLPNGTCSVKAAGIGTIELSLRKSPYVSSQTFHGILCLTDVLHIPELPFNVIGNTSDIGKWEWENDTETNGFLYDHAGDWIACFLPQGNSYFVPLQDMVTGSMIETGTERPLREYPRQLLSWRKEERNRWDAHRPKQFRLIQRNTCDVVQEMKKLLEKFGSDTEMKKEIAKPSSGDLNMDDSPYIPAEKAWLEVSFGSEGQFLQIHGLSPCETDHRREGRKMARAMILHRLKSEKDDEEMYHKQGSEWRPDYSHPDCKFSTEEVKLINERWGNAVKLMRALQLNVCNGQDWKIAKEVLSSFQSRDSPV
ncbi:hypothetical protein F4678DRAFT_457086 [Xylaria arbuscula]|nr:hypothetical protein F4678DRAFT_457086 [Xylaria arbuscula]